MTQSRSCSFAAYGLFFLAVFFSATRLHAADVWGGPAFSADPAALRQAAAGIGPAKDAPATVFLNEYHYAFDASGKLDRVVHTIYRIENESGVRNWAGTKGYWKPWYQARPEIKARVIGPDGSIRLLDPSTLNDVPVHQDAPDVYSDDRAFGGPLPAVVPGAIIEEEITTRGTGVMFAGGTVQRIHLGWSVPVAKTRVVLSHPESLPLRYVLHLLPGAAVNKTTANGVETITIEKDSLEAQTERLSSVPYDVVVAPEIDFSTGLSWAKVSSDYARALNEKLRVEDARPLLEGIDVKKGSRREIISRIVSALHKNVRYTGVEFGESSLIPQFPAETLKRKYGDCKDKATLLIAALRAAGIRANLALLSAGPGQDINTELPGMGVFDHAIVYVPAAGSDPDLWIDATAQYARVGYLPLQDSARWALVVDDHTTGLKQIPDLTAEQNALIETREFTMAEYGPAKIVEKTEVVGPLESSYREFYARDSKEVRQNSENYIKDAYLADALGSFEKTDPADLGRPFIVTLSAQGKRGYTDLDDATAAIRVEVIFSRLPAYFLTPEKPESGQPESEQPKARTVDWRVPSFLTEWRYRIQPPPGFKVRSLPSDKVEHLGAAVFSQRYSVDNAGIVNAVLRFDSGKSRLTVDEARVLRDAVVKARKSDAVLVSFEHEGYALLVAGKTREAIAAFRGLIALHPKEALHRIQMARVLLDAGLAEEARSLAKEATELEPGSAHAYSTLGWILQHDLMGRRFKKGFDYAGSVAAYRKAKALDPKDKDVRANLAILLESDAAGDRYTTKAALKDAVAELRELKKLDEEYSRRYDDNLLYDLWYARQFKDLIEFASTLSSTEDRKGLVLAAVAASESPQAALKKSLEMTAGQEERGKILVRAGYMLLYIRRYPQAADMLEAGARGQSNESEIANTVLLLRKTKPHEEIKIAASDPRSAVHRILEVIFSPEPDYDQARRMLSAKMPAPSKEETDKQEFLNSLTAMRGELRTLGLPLEPVADIALSNMHYSLEGDDHAGYKISAESPGSQTQEFYVVKEGDTYRIAAFMAEGVRSVEDLCWQALARLEQNDLPGARRWLDWAREKIHATAGDDPLAIQPFAHFWTKGKEADAATIRRAALVLMPSKELKGKYLEELIQARDKAQSETERSDLNLVLAFAYWFQDSWAPLAPVAEQLIKASPDSMLGFRIATIAYAGTRRFDDWDKLVNARLQKFPNELDYTRSAANLAAYRGDYTKARALLKGLMDRGKANEEDLNSYAWHVLSLPVKVEQESVDAAQRASELTKHSNFAILHTLACLYAAQGKPTRAREVLLKAMDASTLDEPDDAVWFALGMIAEQYGETEAARKIYNRVAKPKVETPGSSWELAQARLAALPKPDGKAASY